MKWPIFSLKELIIGNLDANIGVCTLWSPKDKFVKKYLGEIINKVAIAGNLYSVFGIGIMIRNYLANPRMRYLIISGTEMGKAKAALEVLGDNSSLLKKLFLEKQHIERFLKQVKIIPVEPDKIREVIEKECEEVFSENEFETIIVPIPKPKTEIFPTSGSGHLIRVATIAEGYEALLREIRLFGHITGEDSEGHRRQELWQLTMTITDQDPVAFSSIPHPEYDEEKIRKYCEDFWNGTEPKDLAYRYGHIMRFAFGDQVEACIEAFKKKTETFRPLICLWDPRVDGGSINSNDPPCVVMMQPRIIGNRLFMKGYIRTNDMFGGWPLNAIAIRYIQYRLAKLLKSDMGLGDLEITSGSAHIYERDWFSIDSFLEERGGVNKKFYPDPKGNFEIKIENYRIVVKHFSPEGELLQEFKGLKALELSKKTAPFISQIGNALYIGRELMKAEILLESKRGEAMEDNNNEEKELSKIGPTFDDVMNYAMKDKDGVIDLLKIGKLEGRFGSNGGRGCDVLEGPCSCGAWH